MNGENENRLEWGRKKSEGAGDNEENLRVLLWASQLWDKRKYNLKIRDT